MPKNEIFSLQSEAKIVIIAAQTTLRCIIHFNVHIFSILLTLFVFWAWELTNIEKGVQFVWILVAPSCVNFKRNALQQNSGLEASKTNIYPAADAAWCTLPRVTIL